MISKNISEVVFINSCISLSLSIILMTEVSTSDKLLTLSEDKSFGLSPNSLPRSASVANLQTASKLILNSKLVYSQQLNLPDGVEVIRATPSAGNFFLYLM